MKKVFRSLTSKASILGFLTGFITSLTWRAMDSGITTAVLWKSLVIGLVGGIVAPFIARLIYYKGLK